MINAVNNSQSPSRQNFGMLHLPKRMPQDEQKLLRKGFDVFSRDAEVYIKTKKRLAGVSLFPPKLSIEPYYSVVVRHLQDKSISSEFSVSKIASTTEEVFKALDQGLINAKGSVRDVFGMQQKWGKIGSKTKN